MAYIDAASTRAIKKELKEAFPGWKFSVRNDGHSAVRVTILEGDVDFGEARNINQYHLHMMGENEPVAAKISEIVHNAPGRANPKFKFFDESDSMTDYFHCAFYVTMDIGSWDKPYVYKGK